MRKAARQIDAYAVQTCLIDSVYGLLDSGAEGRT